jgi:predicted metal-dependent peptidase
MSNKKDNNNNNLYRKKQISDLRLKEFSLSKNLVDFLWSEPFYSRILRSLNKIETKEIPTAGVSTQDEEITLWWNREFLAGLNNKQINGLLKHECLHLVFGHTTERRRSPHLIWNYGTDLAINSTIPEEELPEGGLIPGKHLSLEEDQKKQMSPDQIETYENISKLIASLPKNKTAEFYFEKLLQNEDMKKLSKDEEMMAGIGFDCHNGWDELSDEEREKIAAKIKEVIKDAAREADGRGWGSITSSTRSEIMRLLSNEIKWEALLKRFCGFTKRDDRRSSIRKLNRKYPGIHPGSKKLYKPAIAVYIDESGSVSDKELNVFYGELDSLSNSTDFHVYKFDHGVDDKSSFLWKKRKRPKLNRTLTGGTCFEKVTEHALKNKKKFDAYMILTDGGAPKPSSSRGLKRCWILAKNCKLVFDADSSDIQIHIK